MRSRGKPSCLFFDALWFPHKRFPKGASHFAQSESLRSFKKVEVFRSKQLFTWEKQQSPFSHTSNWRHGRDLDSSQIDICTARAQ
jgi:hypothetical protein